MMKKLILGAAALTLLAGCADSQKLLGLTGLDAPDEFLVVKQAPLTLPPDYRQLPRPQDGAPSLGQRNNTDEARELLLGKDARRKKSIFADSQASGSEIVLLQQSKADQADPNIRNTLRRETEALIAKEGEILTFLTADTNLEVVVDPVEENRRLQNNLSTGKDINEGATPTLEEKEKYFIDYFF